MDIVWEFVMPDLMRYVGGPAGAATLGAVTATAAAWYMMRGRALPPNFMIDLNHQSIHVPGIPGARMSTLCKDGKLVHRPDDVTRTLYDIMKRGERLSNDGQCLGFRVGAGPFQWITYSQMFERAHNAGSGLVNMGLKAVNTTRLGIYAQNSVEYIVTEMACYSQSMVVVPLYDTLGPESCSFIINNAEIEGVLCDTAARVEKLLSQKAFCPNLHYIISTITLPDELIEKAKQLGVRIVSLAEIEASGKAQPQTLNLCTDEDLAIICYTSGTTGTPKGAMLSHGNCVACITGSTDQLNYLDIGPGDTMISYLPLAHMYERTCQHVHYIKGARVGFYRGDVKILLEDIAELKPTVFPTVPRLLNRIYDKVMATVNTSRVKRFLFDCAMKSKMNDINRGIFRKDTIWDKLVFGKIQQSLGGQCKFIVSGSAPLSPRVLDFARCATGATVVEGYGQTENVSVCTVQVQGECEAGHVGPPISSCMIKVCDVPEMSYFAKNDQGEICIKGPIVFKGYLNQPDKTAEAIDKDGWLHSGDIGMWLPNGSLKIIDRKKNIFKLAQGEYIAPEKIENAYISCKPIAQVFVHGNSLKSCLVAIVVPDPETIKKWVMEKLQMTEKMTIQDICQDLKIKKLMLEELQSLGKSSGLHSFEQVKDIYIHPELFSVENGLLTPTFKTKRQEVQKQFAPQIDEMYRHLW